MRVAVLVAAVVLLAGCGAGTKARVTHHQPRIVSRLTGKAAERVGATACRHLPANQSRATGALRAYLQKNHPTDDVTAMLRGCRTELSG
jgi:hypothetical protein